MLTITFTPFPALLTPRLLLREITLDDAPALFAMRSDERVMRHIGRPKQKELSEAVAMIETIQRSFAAQEAVTWGISKHGIPELIGTIGFWKIDKANFRAEIGYMLHPDYWRQGLMSEAMEAAIGYGFSELHFHSIEANTDPTNEATARLLEKHGFVQEAYFRENFYFDGKFLDSRIYSLLRNG
jgi:Acetyltransferases, including N-acetylases of ribosomal proteins